MKAIKKHYHGHRERLRKRFLKTGVEGFSEHEILELVLTLAIPRKDVKIPAKQLLLRFGSLRAVFDATVPELKEISGLGEVAPVALKVIREVATLYLQKRAEETVVFDSPEALEQFWMSRLSGLRNEVFEVAYLDSGYRLLVNGVVRLQEGTVNRTIVYPRRVLEGALQRGAAAVVLAHNHPNRKAEPSEEDKLITKALVQASHSLEVKVLDHLIVSVSGIFSFRKAGLL